MSRPGLIIDVESSTPPILFWHGEQLTTEKLPTGSRIAYGPEPKIGILDTKAAARIALESPLETSPLASKLSPQTKLTIAVDIASGPMLQHSGIDPRQYVIESALEIAARSGVDDLQIIIARGLDRRLTNSEISAMLGDRILDSFEPIDLLVHHDAENEDNLIDIEGKAYNKRAFTSDLLIYVGFNSICRPTGIESIANSLGGAKNTAFSSEDADAIQNAVEIFYVDIVLGSDIFPKTMSFLQTREHDWNFGDHAKYLAAKKLTEIAPLATSTGNRVLNSIRSQQSVMKISAGKASAVTKETSTLHQSVSIGNSSDILTIGIPWIGPFNFGSIMNPVLMIATALNYFLDAHNGTPLVRKGGALIVHHPATPKFDAVHHPSYIDFFNKVLVEAKDAATINAKYREKFATDHWYKHLYQTGYATHGLHPILTWNKCMETASHLGALIVVGGNPSTVHQLGFKSASTMQDALEMARDVTSANPSILHAHIPPVFIADVKQ